MKNLFACLVHEHHDCVVDLVRNLRYLDPDSAILLYNGGPDEKLLKNFPWKRYGAVAHPSPRRMQLGQLHWFALDSFGFAETIGPFDTVTIVDSDQLMVRPGYSAFLEQTITEDAAAGMYGSCVRPQHPGSTNSPTVDAALRDQDLWARLHRKFGRPCPDQVHWTFWPSTIFMRDARRSLVELVRRDSEIRDVLERTMMWASEEILLPTLVALLGYEIEHNPCDAAYVRWRPPPTPHELRLALSSPDAYWIHPVARSLKDSTRAGVRDHHRGYRSGKGLSQSELRPSAAVHRVRPLLKLMAPIEGWLEEDEAEALIGAAAPLIDDIGAPTIVEVGSHCGRATVVLAQLLRSMGSGGRVVAVDVHDGCVGAVDQGTINVGPTYERFRTNLAAAGVADVVESVRQRSHEVDWHTEIDFLLIDGLHDYVNVARDFFSFEPHLRRGGCVAFHDYADYFPGVRTFVDELMAEGEFHPVAHVGSMVILEKIDLSSSEPGADVPTPHDETKQPPTQTDRPGAPSLVGLASPFVSCIMPTYDRRTWIPQALQYFQQQDYIGRELIIVDDGSDPVEDLAPSGNGIRYVRLPVRETMGAKHNIACEMARGDVIVHWDDDDWMAPWRIDYQVRELTARSDAVITGLSSLWFYSPRANRAWVYVHNAPNRPWVCGNSFCYRREWWTTHPHPNMSEGADTHLVWSLPAHEVVPLRNRDFIVAIMHDQNTSPKRTHAPEYAEVPVGRIMSLIGADGVFYRDIAEEQAVNIS